MGDALEQAKKTIPAEIHMISGCRDEQTSADVSNVASFSLPDPAGRAGGALTSCLLNVTYKDHENTGKDLSFQDTLLKVREQLKMKGYSQIPELSSSRPMDIHTKFDLVPENMTGTRRAVMIGINYVGDNPGELRGCHNDVKNMKSYIKGVHGFQEENITVLMDDGKHLSPTRANILAAYRKIVSESQSGDVVFCHYSGHGGKLRDDNGDEKDGFDETLVPVDYKTAGQIRDDDLYDVLVAPMKAGVFATFIMDCCHSGSVLDLPYAFFADGEHSEMQLQEGFDFSPLLSFAAAYMASQQAGDDPVNSLLRACGACILQ
ncbi:caspase domain containing protein [Nitzschia inconspicua]|uniref:Caspase domain containing protein n=1 Tax=Nitzschia inconspicua TaxID=303405 RepID=A0A9K3PGX4_9STRA|nr:caspase domain containing protein [Nitzschia inconspicua]